MGRIEKRGDEGETINLVRVQFNWKDRGWRGLRKEEGHLLIVHDFTGGCVRAGVWHRVGGRRAGKRELASFCGRSEWRLVVAHTYGPCQGICPFRFRLIT